MSTNVTVRSATPADVPSMTMLHDRVFGPGAQARTAYRVREGTAPLSPYCLVCFIDGRLVAALRFTKISVGGRQGALLLGPLAVDPAYAGRGFGRQLVADGLAAARAAGVALVLLVGDKPYYGRLGFVRVPVGQITLPGPVAPDRILAAALKPDALEQYRGLVRGVIP